MTTATDRSADVLTPWQQIAIACYFAASTVVGVNLVHGLWWVGETPSTGRSEVELMMPLQGFVQLVILALAIVVVRSIGIAKVGIRWWGRSTLGLHLVGAYALMMCMWVPFVFFLYPMVLGWFGLEIAAQPHLMFFVDADRDVTFWIVTATVCVIGPVSEELLFRAFLQTGLRRLIGRWSAVTLVAVLFGLIHGLDKALPLALMGGFFGYLRERDDSIAAPILVHCLHNTVTVLLVMKFPTIMQEAFGQ